MMDARVISSSSFPRKERSFARAADFWFDFDLLAGHLKSKPYKYVIKHKSIPASSYKAIYLEMSGSRFATLSETSFRAGVVEIGLEIHNTVLFDERDLMDVISILPIDPASIERIDDGFVWVPCK